LGSRFFGSMMTDAKADGTGISLKPVAPPDMSGKDGIPVVDASKLRLCKEDLGDYIYLAPEKLGGGSHAVDLGAGKTLAGLLTGYFCPSPRICGAQHIRGYAEFRNMRSGGCKEPKRKAIRLQSLSIFIGHAEMRSAYPGL